MISLRESHQTVLYDIDTARIMCCCSMCVLHAQVPYNNFWRAFLASLPGIVFEFVKTYWLQLMMIALAGWHIWTFVAAGKQVGLDLHVPIIDMCSWMTRCP